jgi:hypothetical protein
MDDWDNDVEVSSDDGSKKAPKQAG